METEIGFDDGDASYTFLNRIKRDIPMPAVVLAEITLQGRLVDLTRIMPYDPLPYEPYWNGEGYEFSCGHIVERRIERMIAWDFCFVRLLERYHQSGAGLEALQQTVFDTLVQHCPEFVETDPIHLAALDSGWRVSAGTVVSGFEVVAHFFSENDARLWVISTLITEHLPNVLQAAVRHVEKT